MLSSVFDAPLNEAFITLVSISIELFIVKLAPVNVLSVIILDAIGSDFSP